MSGQNLCSNSSQCLSPGSPVRARAVFYEFVHGLPHVLTIPKIGCRCIFGSLCADSSSAAPHARGAAAKCFICSSHAGSPFRKGSQKGRTRPFPRADGMSPLYSCITLSRARGKDDVNIFHEFAISAMVGSWISSRLHHLFRRQAVSASPRSGFQLRGCGAARFLSPISPTRTNINAKPVSLPFAAGVLLWQQIILNEFSWTIALCE